MRSSYKLVAVSTFAFAIGMSSVALGETVGQYLDDTTITTKVKTAIMTDPELKASAVNVATDQGTVQLTGQVTNVDQESEAVRAANSIVGVKAVKDLLQVRTTQEE